MVIKVSTLLAHNTSVIDDLSPVLGGALNTSNFPIVNGGSPVTITGNNYPTITGTVGQVLTTNGSGTLSWQSPTSGSITLIGDVTGTGMSPVTTTISPTGVIAGSYGSASSVATYAVNSKGQLTAAGNAPISITPSQAGLGNVTNQLQVINAGGAPSIQESAGIPSGSASLGAIYVDQSITNGNSIYRYNGSTWDVIATKPNLYSEKVNGFVAPVATALDSVAIGSGAETQTGATGSLAIGLQSLARIQGGVVQASGRFASNGDAQAGRYMLRTTTIDGTSTEMFINGTNGGQRLMLTDDATWTFKVTVTAHRTDLNNGRAGYTAAGVIYRNAGAATTRIQGSVQKTVLAESNPTWDINITADAINGSLTVKVTGEAGKQIRWVALVETVEITN
jgi:hypothetical protein